MRNNFMNDEFRESIIRLNKSMEQYYKRININTAKISRVASEAFKTIKLIDSTKFPRLPKIEFSADLKDMLGKLAENIKDTIVSIEDYKEFCLLLGYPPHNDISISKVRGIVDVYNESNGDIDQIKPIIDKFYIDKFDVEYIKEEFLAKWYNDELLDKRMKIIEESINCFEQGLYFSAIPLLLSQLEGMVAKANNHCGQMNGYKYKSYMAKIFSNEGNFSYDNELLEFYGNILYVGFEHGKELESFLSRHAIMHGGDVEYGTQQNYIKLILFFDSVHDKLIEKKENNASSVEN